MTMRWLISSGMVEIEFDELLEDRPLAIYIRIDDKKYWLPKSQVDFREWSHIVEVPEWLAKQKGLI